MYSVTNIFNTTQYNCYSIISMWTMIIIVLRNISFFSCVFLLENLAFQKPTYQHSWAVSGGTSEKAVDGNSNMNFADGSCTFGAHSNFPWWRVDLGQDEFVTEVYLVNIKALTRLSKFEIRVGRLIHIQ